jgi:hypothetical protein
MSRRAPWSRSLARTYAAWERFAAGEEHPEDVPLGIATSWHRCRDVYRIDPRHVPPGTTGDDALYGPVHATLFTELGGLAASLTARHDDCLAVVTDGEGRIVASRGVGPSGRRARDTAVSPASLWAETAAGTNAIGTALVQRHAAGVRGPEHWNSSLHDWSCASVALCDTVTGAPLATLSVSSWKRLVPVRPVDLVVETRPLGCELRQAAARDRARLLAAFARLEPRRGAAAAVDAAGRVVVADPAPTGRHRRDDAGPGAPAGLGAVDLPRVAARVRTRARRDPDWRGTLTPEAPDDGGAPFQLIPVTTGAEVVGFLAVADPSPGPGEPVSPGGGSTPDAAGAARPARVPALTDNGQVVLLPVAGIRHARADGHTVWLTTDDGVLRAARRGIDHLEHDLAGTGFLRVHRSYLVNLARVREVTAERGGLTLRTATHRAEPIPVSRRSAPTVRRRLGL